MTAYNANFLSNIIIDGNTFDSGYETSDNINAITYNYTYDCIVGNATIVNNYFGGSVTAFLFLAGQCTVTNNKFYRKTNIISEYIYNGSSFGHVITNNFFDNPTVDGGTNENLVTNLTADTVYLNNKNQSGYISILKSSYATLVTGYHPTQTLIPFTSTNSDNAAGTIQYTAGTTVNLNPLAMESITTTFTTGNVNPPSIEVQSNIDISSLLPTGVQLLNAIVGVYYPGNYLAPRAASFSLSFMVSRPLTYAISSPTGTVADVAYSYNNGGSSAAGGGAGYSGADVHASAIGSYTSGYSGGSTTAYATVDFTSVATYYVNTGSTKITATWINQYVTADQNAATRIALESPLIIKYRW